METITNDERLMILYGKDILSIYGVPQSFELLKKYGSRIFDKRTHLHKVATELRREELKRQYNVHEKSFTEIIENHKESEFRNQL